MDNSFLLASLNFSSSTGTRPFHCLQFTLHHTILSRELQSDFVFSQDFIARKKPVINCQRSPLNFSIIFKLATIRFTSQLNRSVRRQIARFKFSIFIKMQFQSHLTALSRQIDVVFANFKSHSGFAALIITQIKRLILNRKSSVKFLRIVFFSPD